MLYSRGWLAKEAMLQLRRAVLLTLFLAAILVAACGGGQPAPVATPSPGATSTPGPPTPTPVTGPPPISSTADLVERLRPSVVQILSQTATLEDGGGTGFIVDKRGYIVTNNHVVTLDRDQPAQRITVTLSDGSAAAGPADRAGLKQGDIIVKLADMEIRSSGDLFRALTQHRGERR